MAGDATVGGDEGAVPTPKPAKGKKGPGEGLPPHLYAKVKRAIYQSHGNSFTAVTMFRKLDACHSAFQLQKFLIKWGPQFSKLAMLGVRLEMMVIAHGGGNADQPEPEQEQGVEQRRPESSFASGFKQTLVKHNLIAEAVRAEQAARAKQMETEWAVILAQLDEQEATFDEERGKRRSKTRARSRTKPARPRSAGTDGQEPEPEPEPEQEQEQEQDSISVIDQGQEEGQPQCPSAERPRSAAILRPRSRTSGVHPNIVCVLHC
jgi:hypothetical protein